MKEKNKIPPIIIVFLVFVGFILLSFLSSLSNIQNYETFLKTLFLGKIGFIVYSLGSLAILTFIFVGTIKRKAYARALSFVYFPLSFIFSVWNFIYYKTHPEIISEAFPFEQIMPEISLIFSKFVLAILLISTIFSFLFLIFVMILMFKKKDYFSD